MSPKSKDSIPDISSLSIFKDKVTKPKKQVTEVADSWEDEDVESDDGGVSLPVAESKEDNKNDMKKAEVKPTDTSFLADQVPFYNQPQKDRLRGSAPEKRPEKTVATANRMIASALGVRLRPTEEQRRFQKTQIENEKKRLEKERLKKVEDEKAKKSMWGDD